MQAEPRGSVLHGLLLGFGINLAVTVGLIAPLALPHNNSSLAVAEGFAVLGSATGITQALWIYPLARKNYYAERTATAKGLGIAAIITLAVNATVWFSISQIEIHLPPL